MQAEIREFIKQCEEQGLVTRVKESVHLLGVPGLMKEAEQQGKLLIVEKPQGFSTPIYYNVLGSQQLTATAFACEKKDVIRKFIKGSENLIEPKLVSSGPVQEMVFTGDDVDLTKLPMIVHSKKDGGRYISAGVVVAKDPEMGVRNMSFNRMQLKGQNKLGIRMMPSNHLGMLQQKYEEMNKPMEVAVVLGSHPFELIAAAS